MPYPFLPKAKTSRSAAFVNVTVTEPTAGVHVFAAVLAIGLCLASIFLPAGAAESIALFNGTDLQGWEQRKFKGETLYAWTTLDGEAALKAVSDASASGLFRKVDVDLMKTPYLHWRWRIDKALTGNDETTKAGDDYPARVYVVVSGGLFFWRTRAVNYVWASQRPVGSTWPNAYTGNAKMMALRSGESEAGRWVQERRNVREDLRSLFGEDITHIDAVAVMTDTDNTGQSATAYYQAIYFSDQ